jgi:hypothetical protein
MGMQNALQQGPEASFPTQPSFRGDAQHRTRNLELIISGFRVHRYAVPRNDGVEQRLAPLVNPFLTINRAKIA